VQANPIAKDSNNHANAPPAGFIALGMTKIATNPTGVQISPKLPNMILRMPKTVTEVGRWGTNDCCAAVAVVCKAEDIKGASSPIDDARRQSSIP
jgi:hypothetical protein